MELGAGIGDDEKRVGMGSKCRKSYGIGDGKDFLVVMVGEAEDGITVPKQLKRYYAILELRFIENLLLLRAGNRQTEAAHLFVCFGRLVFR
jgi:hypothetical protein